MQSFHLPATIVGITALFAFASMDPPKSVHWPAQPSIDQSWLSLIDKANQNPSAAQFVADPPTYKSDGEYMGYASKSAPRSGDKIQLDEDGLPKVKYGESFYYNPVTLAQFALASYSRYLAGGPVDPFEAATERLLGMVGKDGALRYPFAYPHYVDTLPLIEGWTSGMAQGQFLSTAGRAFHLTGDQKYLDAGDKVLAFLQIRHPYGPESDLSDLDPSLSGYVFFLEYPTEPNVYTLNGFMFTLLGLYDWATLANSEAADVLFGKGIRTLENILPYYDLGKISSYDLSYITHAAQPFQVPRKPHIAASYHAVHVNLLNTLHSVTGNDKLKRYADKWASYVKRPVTQ